MCFYFYNTEDGEIFVWFQWIDQFQLYQRKKIWCYHLHVAPKVPSHSSPSSLGATTNKVWKYYKPIFLNKLCGMINKNKFDQQDDIIIELISQTPRLMMEGALVIPDNIPTKAPHLSNIFSPFVSLSTSIRFRTFLIM